MANKFTEEKLKEWRKKFKPKFKTPLFKEFNEKEHEDNVKVKGSVKEHIDFLSQTIEEARKEERKEIIKDIKGLILELDESGHHIRRQAFEDIIDLLNK